MKINRLLSILAATGSLFAAATSATAEDTVKIGMVMPLSGPLAAAGTQVVAGARFNMRQRGDRVAASPSGCDEQFSRNGVPAARQAQEVDPR